MTSEKSWSVMTIDSFVGGRLPHGGDQKIHWESFWHAGCPQSVGWAVNLSEKVMIRRFA